MNLPTDKNRRVLVIDDNRAIHDEWRKLLCPNTASGTAVTETIGQTEFEMDSAYQGQEGVRLVDKAREAGRPYAMAFVEVRMPRGWDGMETTRRIWAIDPEIQIVLCMACSDYSWGEMFEQLGRSGGWLILKKPFDGVEALQLAHALAEEWDLHQQSRRKIEELERRVAERTHELQEKTAFLEAQVGSSIDGILVVDQTGKQILQNEQLVELFKIPPSIAGDEADENRLQWVTGMTKTPEQFLERVRQLYAHPNEIGRDEIELKDGSVLDRYSSPVVGKDGKYYGRIWAFRDITARKLAEEALRESEARFRDLFEHSTDLIQSVTPEGRFLYVNRAWHETLGYTKEDLSRLTLFDVLGKSCHAHCQEMFQRLMSGAQVGRMETIFVAKNGQQIEVEGNVNCRFKDGQAVATRGIFRDITERKRSAETLAQERNLLRTVIDALPDFIYVKDCENRFLLSNVANARLLGIASPEQLVGKTDFDFFPPELAAEYLVTEQAVIRNGQPLMDVEERLFDQAGGERWQFTSQIPLRGLEGKVIGLVGLGRDITTRKRAEDALRESEERFRLVVEDSPDSIGIYQEGRLVFINSAGARLMRAGTKEELLGRTSEQIIHPNDLKEASDRIRRRLAGETGLYPAEVRYLRLDGTSVTVEVSAAPVTFKGNPAVQFTARDITERKRAEDELRESEERFSGAFEHAPIGLALVAPAGQFLKVNRALCELTGYAETDLLTRTFQDITHPEDLELDLENVRGMLATEIHSYQMEKRYIHARGHCVTALLNVSLVRDGEGQPHYFISQIQDITERKLAEAALHRSEARTNAIVQSSLDCIISIDHEGRIIGFNPAAEKLFGYEGPEVLGRELAEVIIPPSLRARHREGMQLYLATGEARVIGQRIEISAIRSDGSEFPVELAITRMGTETPPIFTGFIRDISERKRAEETLRESNEKFHQLADNITDVFWIRSPDLSEVHYLSPAFEKVWGRSVKSLLADPHEWTDFILPEDRERVLAAFAALKSEAPRLDIEYRIVRPNGEIRWVQVRGFQVRDAADKLIRHIGIVTDITERKRREISANAFSKLGHLLSSATSTREAFASISQVSHELFGWDAFWINLYRATDGLIHSEFAVDTINGRQVVDDRSEPRKPSDLSRRVMECGAEIIVRDEATAPLSGSVPFGNKARLSAVLLFVPIRSKGTAVGILSIQSYTFNAYDGQDLKTLQTMADQCGGAFERIWADEALRKSEAHLFEAQKMETVGKLAGGVAHEFNSILTAIIGQSELLNQDLPAGSPLARRAAEISKAAGRASTLTRQLLAYGRKQFLRPEALNLNQVLSGMDGVVRQLMGGQTVDVRVIRASGLHLVKADTGQIEQVIMNVVMNARDAMPNGGKLTLETVNVSIDQESVSRYPELKPGHYVMLAITDTGTGMTEEVRARAFEPFFTTKDVGQGTGLGLSTCYGIVKQSGGHITVYSEPGRGTTVKIYLPQVEAEVKIPGKQRASLASPGGTETILLVEGDPALREMAAALLIRLGYKVLAAANGTEALSLKQQANSGNIDLLLTDVALPQMSGKELADRVLALSPKTRILFTSAYTENAAGEEGALSRGMAMLRKPFAPSELARKVREVLDQSDVSTVETV